MWPWEHLALGYLWYSAYTHARFGRSPDGGATLALAFGTQFPDLVDKPLAWTLTLLPSGRSLAHSLLFALPLIGIVLLVAHRSGKLQYGGAFAVGYLSHLPGDVLYPLAFGDGPSLNLLLWPLLPVDAYEAAGFFSRTTELISEFVGYLDTPAGYVYLLLEVTFLLSAALLWKRDGTPGVGVWTRLYGRKPT